MELKSRQTYILRSLLDADREVTSAELLEKLGIAKRTFYYDVEKINDYLAQHGMGPVSYTHLDVYKRQDVDDPVAAVQSLHGGYGPGGVAKFAVVVVLDDIPVSYTHLCHPLL